jgi:biotin carboxyl carrier protein
MNSSEVSFEGGQVLGGATDDQRVFETDRAVWTQFAEAKDTEGFCRSWLAIQCRSIMDVVGGLVLLGKQDMGPFSPVAVWPDVRCSMEHLVVAATRSVVERRGVLVKIPHSGASETDNESYHVGYPIEVDKKLHGAIVLDVGARSESQVQAVLRRLHWGSAWLELMIRRQESLRAVQTQDHLMTVLELTASAIEQKRFYAAALALATELATRFSCSRVSLGFRRKQSMAVTTISHSARFDKNSNLIRAIGAAMDESFDQQTAVIYPHPGSETIPPVSRAQEELSRLDNAGTVCSIPLYSAGKIIGVITFERTNNQPFDQETLKSCEAIATMAGPVLEAKRKEDRSVPRKIIEYGGQQLTKLVGPAHVGFKLSAILVSALMIFLIFAQGIYRISAKTIIEGQVQRVIAAPFEGYISEADARAGDIVVKDQILATLDDKDIKIQRLKTIAQREQLLRQHREAMGEHDRAQNRITLAQLKQVNAQLALLNFQLSRTKLTAPFDGIVVTGDLSQSLGAPVEKGQALFEIAPLEAYRVILQVDEHDIADVVVNQLGMLTLSSLPGEQFQFNVEKITPVSTAEEGRNYFRVEARFEGDSAWMRPGMEGVGKIYVDRRKQVWIWTHRLIDWLRLWVWSWWP